MKHVAEGQATHHGNNSNWGSMASAWSYCLMVSAAIMAPSRRSTIQHGQDGAESSLRLLQQGCHLQPDCACRNKGTTL